MNATELKTALKRAGMSQEELGRRLGHTRALVSRWIEKDEVRPEWVPLVRDVLGMEPEPQLPAPNPLDRYSAEELLGELLDREKKRRGR